jgi:hypothetical protein
MQISSTQPQKARGHVDDLLVGGARGGSSMTTTVLNIQRDEQTLLLAHWILAEDGFAVIDALAAAPVITKAAAGYRHPQHRS